MSNNVKVPPPAQRYWRNVNLNQLLMRSSKEPLSQIQAPAQNVRVYYLMLICVEVLFYINIYIWTYIYIYIYVYKLLGHWIKFYARRQQRRVTGRRRDKANSSLKSWWWRLNNKGTEDFLWHGFCLLMSTQIDSERILMKNTKSKNNNPPKKPPRDQPMPENNSLSCKNPSLQLGLKKTSGFFFF